MIPYRPGDREVRRDPSRRNLRYYWDEREGAYVYENGYALAPVPQQARAGRSSSQLPDYCRQAADFFKVGKVFTKMSDDVDESTATSARTPTNLGDFRRKERFVVVGRKADYCQVVPLTTYNGLGVSKQGVIKSDHAIIYTGLQAPERLPAERPDRNEDGMRPYAIRVLNDDRTERLQDTCRVNFADMQKIPLDTPVKSFGVVADDSLPALKYQLRAVLFEEPLPSPAALSSSADTVRGAPSAAPTSWRQPPNRDQPRAESSTRRPAGPIQSHPDSAQQRSVRRLSTTLATASDDQGYPEFRRLSRPQDFFVVGRVFSVLCPDTAGNQGSTAQSDWNYVSNARGQLVLARVCRYVVVSLAPAQCYCVRILTYSNQGLAAPGVRKSEHGVIYTENPVIVSAEQARQGEAPMKPRALKVTPRNPLDRLEPSARVHYAARVIISYTERVKNFGMLDEDCIADLLSQTQEVQRALGQHRSTHTIASSSARGRARAHNNNDDDDDDDGDDDEDDESDNETAQIEEEVASRLRI